MASTTSSVPHPFFFNQPREVTGDATGVKRSETAVHVQAMYLVEPGGRLRLVLSGGPSFFTVEQDLVTEVTITETFPFDTAAFASARKSREKGSAAAFNVGADVMWMLNRTLGVGGLVRFSQASVDLDAPANRTISVDAGGVYAGGRESGSLLLSNARFEASSRAACSPSCAGSRPAACPPTATSRRWRAAPGGPGGRQHHARVQRPATCPATGSSPRPAGSAATAAGWR